MHRGAASACALSAWAALSVLWCSAVAVAALPFGDEPPRYDSKRDVVRVAAWGPAPDHPANLGQVGLGSRRAARLRALGALHTWVDDALRGRSVSPMQSTRLHEAVERAFAETDVRLLADGTVVLCGELAGAALRDATTVEGLPWRP